jgi:hypothetical protein
MQTVWPAGVAQRQKTRHINVEGSNPATETSTGREKMAKSLQTV